MPVFRSAELLNEAVEGSVGWATDARSPTAMCPFAARFPHGSESPAAIRRGNPAFSGGAARGSAEATRLDLADLPEYAGRVHDYFIRHPDRFRLMSWGRMELAGDAADAATRETVRRKVEQLRKAQDAGHLDPAWEPIDILVFVNQIAMAWAGHLDLVDAAADQVRDPSLAARRAAVVAAVQRLFPATANDAADGTD